MARWPRQGFGPPFALFLDKEYPPLSLTYSIYKKGVQNNRLTSLTWVLEQNLGPLQWSHVFSPDPVTFDKFPSLVRLAHILRTPGLYCWSDS